MINFEYILVDYYRQTKNMKKLYIIKTIKLETYINITRI